MFPGTRIVVVVTLHNRLEPLAGLAHGIVQRESLHAEWARESLTRRVEEQRWEATFAERGGIFPWEAAQFARLYETAVSSMAL